MPLSHLTSDRLALRPPRPEDAQAVYDGYARDLDVARYVTWTPHTSIQETHEFLRTFIASGERGRDYPWMITLKDGALIGAMHLRLLVPRAEIGFNIARAHWRRGYGTEAVRTVNAFALSLPGIRRVQAICHVDNEASARVLQKAGMQREGRLRRYLVFPNLGDAAEDVWLYARTIDDRVLWE